MATKSERNGEEMQGNGQKKMRPVLAPTASPILGVAQADVWEGIRERSGQYVSTISLELHEYGQVFIHDQLKIQKADFPNMSNNQWEIVGVLPVILGWIALSSFLMALFRFSWLLIKTTTGMCMKSNGRNRGRDRDDEDSNNESESTLKRSVNKLADSMRMLIDKQSKEIEQLVSLKKGNSKIQRLI